MGVKDFGKHKYRIEMGDGYIQDMFAVQNDTDSRVYEFQIFTAEGSLASATGLSLKLAVDSGDGKVIICDGVLTDSSNAIFTATLTTSQLLSSGKKKAQVMLIEGTKNLRSKTFIIDVGVSLFEGGQYGHNVIVDFEKISNTISRLDDIESSFIANATTKFNEYNSNAINKLNTYNSNHTSKLNDYNSNHTTKLSAYNSNATNKINEFNVDAESKKSILENIQSNVNQTAESINSVKSDFDSKKIDFDNKYDGITDIVHAENERVQAENLRQQHDERIQRLLNDGLNSELGEYVKKENIVDDLTTGGSDKALSAEQGKVLFQSVSNGKQLIASAITDKGIQTEATSEFSVMANNIKAISSSGGGISDDDKLKIKRITNYLIEAFNDIDKCGVYIDADALNSESLIKTDGNIDLNELERRVIILRNASSKILDYSQVIHDSIKDYLSGKIVYNEQNITPIIGGPLHWLMCLTYTAMPND